MLMQYVKNLIISVLSKNFNTYTKNHMKAYIKNKVSIQLYVSVKFKQKIHVNFLNLSIQ